MPWWGWIVVGAALLAAEMLAIDTGFYLAIFGVAALLVGLGAALGLTGPFWGEWAIFAVLSIALLLGVRRPLQRRLRGGPLPGYESLVGEVATVSEEIEPGGVGRAQLRGADWTAHNTGESTLGPGARARVERVRNLVIDVQAEES